VNKKVIYNELKELFNQPGPTFQLDLIAGSDRLNPKFMQTWPRFIPESACFPAMCCVGVDFIKKFPCVMSKDAAADYYVYNIAFDRTYTMTIPLMRGLDTAYNSTIDPGHNLGGLRGLDRVDKLIRDLYRGYIQKPPYLRLRDDLVKYYKEWRAPVRINPTKRPISAPTKHPSKPKKKNIVEKKKPDKKASVVQKKAAVKGKENVKHHGVAHNKNPK
jgi:hypothetical protein